MNIDENSFDLAYIEQKGISEIKHLFEQTLGVLEQKGYKVIGYSFSDTPLVKAKKNTIIDDSCYVLFDIGIVLPDIPDGFVVNKIDDSFLIEKKIDTEDAEKKESLEQIRDCLVYQREFLKAIEKLYKWANGLESIKGKTK